MIPVFRFRSSALLESLADLPVRQLPYVMMLGINALGRAAQKDMQAGLRARFELRRVTWNVNAIKIEKGAWATKTRWRVVISIDPRASYLEKFEEEGVHEPFGDRNYVWVPNNAVFRKRIIRADNPLHPKQLHLRREGARVVGDLRTFMVRGSGGPVVMQRLGPGSGTHYTPSSIANLTLERFGGKRMGRLRAEKKEGTRILYTLKERVTVPLKLEFVETVTRTVQTQAVPIFRESITRALNTARR